MRTLDKIGYFLLFTVSIANISSSMADERYCGEMSYCNNVRFIIKNETKKESVIITDAKMQQGELAISPNKAPGCKGGFLKWDPAENYVTLEPQGEITVYGHEINANIIGEIRMVVENKRAGEGNHLIEEILEFHADRSISSCKFKDLAIKSRTDSPYTVQSETHEGKGTDAFIKFTVKDK